MKEQPGPRLHATLVAPQKVAADANKPESHHRKAGWLRHRGGHRKVGRGKSGEFVAAVCAVQVQHASKNLQVRVAVIEIRRIHQARQIEALIEVHEESGARGRDLVRDKGRRVARTERGARIVVVVEVLQHNHIDAAGWNVGRQSVHEIDSARRVEDCWIKREDISGDRKVNEILAADNLSPGGVQNIRSGERVCIESESRCMRGRAHDSERDPHAIFSETQFVTPLEQELRAERLSFETDTQYVSGTAPEYGSRETQA